MRTLIRELSGTLEDVVGLNEAAGYISVVGQSVGEQMNRDYSEKIVLGNTRCPFGDKVLNRPSMCMMTSNVFGSIAAQNLGCAKVELQDTVAEGKPGCRVVVYLNSNGEAQTAKGREYFIEE